MCSIMASSLALFLHCQIWCLLCRSNDLILARQSSSIPFAEYCRFLAQQKLKALPIATPHHVLIALHYLYSKLARNHQIDATLWLRIYRLLLFFSVQLTSSPNYARIVAYEDRKAYGV